MNYCEKIHYTILSTKRAEFAVMVDDLLSQLPQNEVIMRLAFFGTPGTNEEYVARRVLLREKIRRYYGDCEPALSYVSQPPLNAPLLMEVHSYVPDAQDRITFRHYQGVPYVLLENASGRFLFAGGFQCAEKLSVLVVKSQNRVADDKFHDIGQIMALLVVQHDFPSRRQRRFAPKPYFRLFSRHVHSAVIFKTLEPKTFIFSPLSSIKSKKTFSFPGSRILTLIIRCPI